MRRSADDQVRQWQEHIGVKTLFIEPGSPWENRYNESFNGKLRNELLNRELLTAEKNYAVSNGTKAYQCRRSTNRHF
jgi:transposase InsO family protein